jgi:GNAT superfamily N-acetyltransferase
MEISSGDYAISSDPSRLDVEVIHAFLTVDSYWARGITRERVQRSLEHSLCFGVYHGARQVGFARLITDRASFAYLCDVFILEPHRGRGLGKRLVAAIHGHSELAGVRRWMLATRDAQGLYAQFGWRALEDPSRFMEILRPYQAEAAPPSAPA